MKSRGRARDMEKDLLGIVWAYEIHAKQSCDTYVWIYQWKNILNVTFLIFCPVLEQNDFRVRFMLDHKGLMVMNKHHNDIFYESLGIEELRILYHIISWFYAHMPFLCIFSPSSLYFNPWF